MQPAQHITNNFPVVLSGLYNIKAFSIKNKVNTIKVYFSDRFLRNS